MSSSNVTSVTKYFSTANEGFNTTLTATIAASATSVGLNSTSGLTNGSVFVGIIEPAAVAQQTFTGTVDVSGSQITNVIWVRGNNVGHAGGVTIVDYVSGAAHNMATTGVLKQHTQAGAHSAITNTGGLTTDTATITGNATVDGSLGITGVVGGAGYSLATISNPYKFSAYATTITNIGASGTTKVALNGEVFDTGNNFDSTTNSRFVAPVAGFYFITACVQVSSAGMGTTANGTAFIYKNGAEWKRGQMIAGSGNSLTTITAQISDVMQLAANDYVELWAYNGDSSTRSTGSGSNITYMSGFLVSAT